jgi:long-chain fatty acid transport protein
MSEAQAGAFGVREQSTYFMGDAYAGAAAGGDISSMFWNPAATATLPGFNSSTSYTGVIGRANETATGGLFVTGNPNVGAPGLAPSTDVGTSAFVPASYLTLQLTDRLYAGVGLNAPFGFVTKPDNLSWAGSPIATTTKVFSLDANPTIAYKITPTLTVGAGVQIEYFEIKVDRSSFNSLAVGALSPSRTYKADDVGVGATAGVLWQPREGTSVGLGYRSAVSMNVSGLYTNGGFVAPTGAFVQGFSAIANGKLTLPDEITFSVRQAVTQQLALLGTVEWNRWSSLGNVSATGAACPVAGTCETLHLNYQDGWFFSLGAEYAYSPSLTLRTGVGYEISPIKDSVRDILLPDSNRVHLNVGASYRWSDKITINAAYSHLFFDDAPFCIAQPVAAATTHCVPGNVPLLNGSADVSVDIVSVGVNYKFYGPEPLEPLK